ncbi:4Fe-4S binding protein [Methanoplanus sp. FWC-SCC4]|uniref:4Fe-4S binding protein n=1 Tax=Methanochimaera problematica TaxID=2609417 RepID=A0AA97FFH3_9EURY|nr:4Fe-4S binding protein [Methanoplanus sp. FWC-SCC4]WOF17343.1 4Fe-4S binding protein [Methanoplanus sp. FWC-SCC4]
MVSQIILREIGYAYAVILVLLLAYLWYSKKITRKQTIPVLVLTTIVGFITLAPLAPHNFQSMIVSGLNPSLTVAAWGLAIIFVLTFLFGRIFCGHLCPAGAVQELVYLIPCKKFGRTLKKETIAVRVVVFFGILAAAWFYSFKTVKMLGISDFFHLILTTGTVIFIAILIVSVFFYRPFCRLICPYGTLLLIPAAFSVFKIRRTDSCVSCRNCESVCPVDEAKPDDKRAECFMCGRCLESCNKFDAMSYGKK